MHFKYIIATYNSLRLTAISCYCCQIFTKSIKFLLSRIVSFFIGSVHVPFYQHTMKAACKQPIVNGGEVSCISLYLIVNDCHALVGKLQ